MIYDKYLIIPKHRREPEGGERERGYYTSPHYFSLVRVYMGGNDINNSFIDFEYIDSSVIGSQSEDQNFHRFVAGFTEEKKLFLAPPFVAVRTHTH